MKKPAKKSRRASAASGYRDLLSLDEAAVWDRLGLGSLDDEIRLCRLELRRVLLARQDLAGRSDASSSRRSSGEGQGFAAMDRLIGRILQLEKARAGMEGSQVMDHESIAAKIKAALEEIDELTSADPDADTAPGRTSGNARSRRGERAGR